LYYSDADDPWPTDIRRVYARTTDSLLTLRVETWEPWNSYPYPVDTVIGTDTLVFLDTSFAMAMYLDSDRNPLTGRLDGAGQNLNGIGADHRILVGFFGGDTTLSYWDPPPDSVWALIYDTTGLAYHDVPPDSNIFIVELAWSDFGMTAGVDMMLVNAVLDLDDPDSFIPDFAPNLGQGAIEIDRADRWIGEGYSKSSVQRYRLIRRAEPVKDVMTVNPFD
jgi:hypothetical protein